MYISLSDSNDRKPKLNNLPVIRLRSLKSKALLHTRPKWKVKKNNHRRKESNGRPRQGRENLQ